MVSHVAGCSGLLEVLVAEEAMEMAGCPISNKSVASDEYTNTWSLNLLPVLYFTQNRMDLLHRNLSVHDKLHNP
ncbi:hypothetical protein M758_5G056500 [Ceratodon purpureus]|nr:hypothetical protein M758_5G056500 [Ceratodon purpureus]